MILIYILIAVICIGPFIYLGHVLSKLDNFLDKNSIAPQNDKNQPYAVVFGKTKIADQVKDKLNHKNIPIYSISTPYLFEQGYEFRYLFALSDDDSDNIAISIVGKKIYNIDHILSICNDLNYANAFREDGIQYYQSNKVSAEMLCQILERKVDLTNVKKD